MSDIETAENSIYASPPHFKTYIALNVNNMRYNNQNESGVRALPYDQSG